MSLIVKNKKASFEYFIEDRIEAGVKLEGWEVKALREGRAQLVDGYVSISNGEAWLHGVNINPCMNISTHVIPEIKRNRKLLLKKREISRLQGQVCEKGYTLVVTSLYWSNGKVKAELGVAKGKKQHDKRQSQKEKDWSREKARFLKHQ